MTKVHRRKYRADPMAFARVIALTEKFNEEELVKMLLPTRMAFNDLLAGVATPEAVDDIISTLNVTVVRAGESDMQAVARPALEAMRRCRDRYLKLGKWGLDGPGISEVEMGLQLHEQLCRLSTPRQMRDAAMVVDNFRREHAKQH